MGRALDAQRIDLPSGAAESGLRQVPERAAVARADGHVGDVEEDGFVEHQPVAPAVGGHQADVAPRCLGRAFRQPAPIRKTHLAAARLAQPEQHVEEIRDARSFQPGKADDLAGAGGEAGIVEPAAAEAANRDPLLCGAGLRRQGRREKRLALLADHALDDLRNGQRGPLFGQHVAAVAGDGDTVGDGKHFLQPMRHVEHGDAARAQALEHREQPLGFLAVERRVRFVEDQQPRLFQQHAGQFDELPLADAEAADRRVNVDMQAELLQQAVAAVLHLALGNQSAAHRLAIDEQIGQHRAFRKQAEFLIHHADAVLAGGIGAVDGHRLSVEFDDAAVRPDHAGEHLHQRRFAGAVFADHGVDRAPLDGQVHVVERNDAAIALGEIAHGNHRRLRHALPKKTGAIFSNRPREELCQRRIIRLRPRSAAAPPRALRPSACRSMACSRQPSRPDRRRASAPRRRRSASGRCPCRRCRR